MTRADYIHAWALRHAERLLFVVSCMVFGVLGLLGRLTAFVMGPLPSGSLDNAVNMAIGLGCLAAAAAAARRLHRRPCHFVSK